MLSGEQWASGVDLLQGRYQESLKKNSYYCFVLKNDFFPTIGWTRMHVLVSLTLCQSSERGCTGGPHRTPAAGAVHCGEGAKNEPPKGLHLRSPWQWLLLRGLGLTQGSA